MDNFSTAALEPLGTLKDLGVLNDMMDCVTGVEQWEASLRAAVEKLEASQSSMKKDLDAITSSNKRMMTSNRQHQLRIRDLEAQLGEPTGESQTAVTDIVKERDAAVAALEGLKQSHEALQGEKRELGQQVVQLNRELEDVRRQLAEATVVSIQRGDSVGWGNAKSSAREGTPSLSGTARGMSDADTASLGTSTRLSSRAAQEHRPANVEMLSNVQLHSSGAIERASQGRTRRRSRRHSDDSAVSSTVLSNVAVATSAALVTLAGVRLFSKQ